MKNTKKNIKFRRRREQKTDYKTRLDMLKSDKPRLVVRRSLQNMYIQIIEYHPDGDKVLFSANTLELKKIGLEYGGNIPAAYLVGYLIGKKAKSFKDEIIIDFGFFSAVKNSRIFAVIKGALDSGLNLRVSDKIQKKFPSEDKLTGKEIANFASEEKESKDKLKFSNYKKKKIDLKNFDKHIEEIKAKIDEKYK